jgi:crotonobetainyl-CoA:carnitine CoA-transferase CaiB-like acyl-CoA transferase
VVDGMSLALDGVRVVDFTWVVAGPQCTQVLADLGAEVIKVEWPHHPDGMRFVARAHGAPADSLEHGGVWNNLNRNKRGITLNMRHPDARELALALIAKSDVVVENFTPGILTSWGLSWDEMKAVNPKLVYLSMTGFGWGGPNERYAVYAPVMQAVSGLMAMTGRPGAQPSGIGFSYADHITGYFGALAVLAALHERDHSGSGTMIDLSGVEATLAVTSTAILDYEVNGRPFSNWGNVPFGSSDAPAGFYRCVGDDQWCAISVRDDEEWAAFTSATGLSALAQDARLATATGRAAHRGLLDAEIETWTSSLERSEVIRVLEDAGVAVTPLMHVDELMEHPALRERDFFRSAEHPILGENEYQMGGFTSEFGPELRAAPPLIGEANAYVYGELLGMTDDEIAERRASAII